MREKTIDAIKVQTGQAVTMITAEYRTYWRNRPAVEEMRPPKHRGKWPTVIDATYLTDGEGGRPTVYIETSDSPGGHYCLRPDDQVTVLVED